MVSQVTGEPYEACACGAVETNVVTPATLDSIARELAKIMVGHLQGLTQKERQKRIAAGKKVLNAIKDGKVKL